MQKGKVLPIAEIGNRVLRRTPKIVSFPLGKSEDQLIADMFATMVVANGVGIAAPQVFQSLQIIIIASRPNERYPYAPRMKPVVMINPKILSYGIRNTVDWEGCLSVPNIRGLVPCADTVSVQYQDITGKSHTKAYVGFPARIIQHEMSHLYGLLFTDRVASSKDLYSYTEFMKRLKRRSKQKIQK